MEKVIRPFKDKWENNISKMYRVSSSQIENLFSCGMKWYSRYIKKLKEAFNANLKIGTIYHAINEALYEEAYKTNGASFDYDDETLKNIAIQAMEKSLAEEFQNHEVLIPGTRVSLMAFICSLIPHYKSERLIPISIKIPDDNGVMTEVSAIELSIEIPVPMIEGFYIVAKIDMIAKDKDGNLVVIDHKTSSSDYSELKVNTNQQLVIYAIAAGEMFKELGIPYSNLVRFDVINKKLKVPRIEVVNKSIKSADIRRTQAYLLSGCRMLSSRALSFCNQEMTCKMCDSRTDCISHGISYADFIDYISFAGLEQKTISAPEAEINIAEKAIEKEQIVFDAF